MRDHSQVSMKDIAARVGCSVSTVSRALRDDPRISSAVRVRIQKKAESLGYVWDRQTSRTMARFRAKATGESAAPEPIALVHAQERRYERQDPLGFWTALTHAADSLGFSIQEFALDGGSGDIAKSGRRLSRVLLNRGIRGMVLFPFYQPDIRHWELDWDAFSMVAVGSSPDQPYIDRVDLSDYEDAIRCLKEIAGRGYRRIGLTSSEDSERHTGGVFVAAYRYFMETHPELEAVPVLRMTGRNRQRCRPEDRKDFEAWFKTNQPDAILTSHHGIRDWLADMGKRVPDDLGLATLWPEKGWSGIEFTSETLMRPALEHLRGKLATNERGPTSAPRRLLIRSPWREGETLRNR